MGTSYAERCMAAENAVRSKCPIGWQQSRAWVGVHLAKPETEAERRALEAVREFFGESVYMPHVYNVVEFASILIQRELDDHAEDRS